MTEPKRRQGRPDLRVQGRALAHRLVPGIDIVAGQIEPYAARWAQQNQDTLSGRGPLWVVLGDSMSQGIGASTFEGGWVNQAALQLAQAGRPYRVLNLSRTGATSQDLVERQLPELQDLATHTDWVPPSLVTVLIGANDMLHKASRRQLPNRYRRLMDGLPPRTIVARIPQPVRTAHRVNDIIDSTQSHGITALDLRPAAKKWRGHLGARSVPSQRTRLCTHRCQVR